jgi:hypothetical protein
MKRFCKVLGLITVTAVLGFLFAGCDSGGGDDSGGGADELNFSNEQVYTEKNLVFTPYTGSMTVTSMGITGSISNGKFSFAIGEVTPNNLSPIAGVFNATNPSFSPSDTQACQLYFPELGKGDSEITNEAAEEFWMEEINYYYVDRDCTVTVPAMSFGSGFSGGLQAATLKLKKGWNAVSLKVEVSYSTLTVNGEMKVCSFSTGKWVIDWSMNF